MDDKNLVSTRRQTTQTPRNGKDSQDLIPIGRQLSVTAQAVVPTLIQSAGRKTKKRFVEYFVAEIRNPRTRAAYFRAVDRFLAWCGASGIELLAIEPVIVAKYIDDSCPEVRPERLASHRTSPTLDDASTKQHLAAIRKMFDYLITGGLLEVNPAASVRGPKLIVETGKTPVMTDDELRMLLGAIDISTIAGLRDRALIYLMFNSFARIGAVVELNAEDVYRRGDRYRVRLHEKGGRFLENWISHKAAGYLNDYMTAAGIGGQRGTPLFRTLDRKRKITDRRLHRNDALGMMKRRAKKVGLNPETCCHSLRASGITEYMKNGGTLEKVPPQCTSNTDLPRLVAAV